MSERHPKPANSELASAHDVGELNAFTTYLIDSYGGNPHPNIYKTIKTAAFSLKSNEGEKTSKGEIRMRRILPIKHSDEIEILRTIEIARFTRHSDTGTVWDIISIETEGSNPEAVEAHRGEIELNAMNRIADFVESVESYSQAILDPNSALMIFGERYEKRQAKLKSIDYTHELHSDIMSAIRDIDEAFNPPTH